MDVRAPIEGETRLVPLEAAIRPLIRRIVAGIATLSPDDPALAAALRLSTRLGAALYMVHVDDATSERECRARTELLREVVEIVEPGATSMGRVVCRAVIGAPHQRLLVAADEADADLLVLGATRRDALAGALLGTTAGRVLRGAHTPMLVVRGPLPDRPLRVLLTTDLSHHAAYAHSRGGALSRALGAPGEAEMRSLFVEAPPLPDQPPFRPPRVTDSERELIDFLRAEVPATPSTPCVRSGEPTGVIVAEAREWGADLLVLGTHGRRGALRLFLGSVAETVLRHAPCATLVIPPMRPYHLEADPARAAGGDAHAAHTDAAVLT
jgi:nucleotide-binding universal stress UspA family protein